jgi:gas vesicle protein
VANSNVATKVAFFLVGCGVGAAVALLFAPQSGEETRKRIAGKAEEGRDYVVNRGREFGRQASEMVDQGKELINRQRDRLADALGR